MYLFICCSLCSCTWTQFPRPGRHLSTHVGIGDSSNAHFPFGIRRGIFKGSGSSYRTLHAATSCATDPVRRQTAEPFRWLDLTLTKVGPDGWFDETSARTILEKSRRANSRLRIISPALDETNIWCGTFRGEDALCVQESSSWKIQIFTKILHSVIQPWSDVFVGQTFLVFLFNC